MTHRNAEPDIVTSLVDLADASQSLATDQFRLLRLETVDEVRRLATMIAFGIPVTGLLTFGLALVVAGAVVALASLVGWAVSLVVSGILTAAASVAVGLLAARFTRPRVTPDPDRQGDLA